MIAFLIHCILGSATPLALPADSLRATNAGAEARSDVDTTRVVAQHSPSAGVMYDALDDGSVIAVGRGWKAHFAADGAQFIPFLGSEASHDEILRFEPASVRAGGEPISSDAGTVPVRNDDTIRYARGAVDELWQMRPESLEHVIVVSSLPEPGELVVRCRVDTSLVAREVCAGVEFESTLLDRTGGVRYSGAVAYDAAGRRCTLSCRWDGAAIVMEVPAEMTHALPLTIDPLVEVFGVATTPSYELSPDASIVLSLGGTHRCEVFETIWSQTDHDVTARVTRLATGAITLHAIDATTEYWSRPKVASILDSKVESEFGIVAAVGVPSAAAREVRGRELRIHFAPPNILGPVVTIGAGGGGDHHSPDIGGDPYAPSGGGGSNYLVVWERDDVNGDSDILAARLIADQSFPVPPIAADPLMDDQSPRVSKSDGTLTWCVVWERHAALGNSDIWSSTVPWDFSVITAPLPISTASEDERNPSASSLGAAGFVIAYQRALAGQSDVMVQVLTGATVGPPVDLTLLEGGSHAPLDQELPVVDGDGAGYLVAYKESDAVGVGLFRTRITGFTLSPTSQIQTNEVHVPLGSPTTDRTRSNVCSEAASTGTNVSRFEVVWDEIAQSTSSDVQAAIWVPGATSGSVVAGCFGDGSDTACPCSGNGGVPAGCPSSVQPHGAELLWSGEVRLAHDTFVVHATRLPLNGVALLAQGTLSFSPAHLYGDGLLCLGGTQSRLAVRAVNANGELVYPATPSDATISIAGGVPVGGASRVYQMVYRNLANFCTSATWNTTNALVASWAP